MRPLAKKTAMTAKKSSGRRGVKQARSLKYRRYLSLLLRGMSVVMVSAGIIASVYIWRSGLLRHGLRAAGDSFNREVAKAGFVVEEVRITGEENTSPKQIRRALGLYDNQSMTSLDLAAMLARLDALPWVKTATISRIIPNILQIIIREYQATALWQKNDRFYLVDRAGQIITDQGVEKYTRLPQIVGIGANDHLRGILAIKQKHPDLFARVKSSVWVGNRRWDLYYYNGIKVKLPEIGPEQAWDKLYHYDRTQKILTKEIVSIDLRTPGKIIVRLTPQEAERRRLILKNGHKEESI